MIRLEGVSYHYQRNGREYPALSSIDMTIKEGTWLTILGSNGSGKTTLAMLLNGLLLPKSGQVTVDGFSTGKAEEVFAVRCRVAYIFQNPENQIIATTVEEDVAFGPENLGLPREEIHARVDSALEAVGMEDYREHAPHLLSGGQKQKVAIAGALAMEPRYLIMDEATSMLDPASRNETIAAVKRLHLEQGITVINISHFIEEALLGDEILVLSKGEIALMGKTEPILSQKETLARYGLDLPPIIELGGRLREHGYMEGDLPLTVEEMVSGLCRLK